MHLFSSLFCFASLQHPKLKSRLQQRYFEGSRASSFQTGSEAQEADEEALSDSCDAGPLAPNNLHLLASAANLHTKRSIGTRVHVAEANRYSKERAARRAMNPATESFSKGQRRELEFFRGTPVLPGLMPPLPSTSRSDVYNRQDFNTAAKPHHPQGVVVKTEKSPTIQPVLGFHDSKEVIFSGARLLGSKHIYLPQKEKVKCNQTAPSSNLKGLTKHGLPTVKSVQGVHCSEEGIGSKARLHDNTCSSPVNEEKAKRLLEHYQNGYHSLIPRDVFVVRKELSPSSEKDDVEDVKIRPHLVHSSQNGSLEGKKMKRRLSTASDVGDYEDKIQTKQLSLRLEKGDLEVEKMRQRSSSSENKDFEVKKMRKQSPMFTNEGDAEVLKRHNSTHRDVEVRKRQDLMQIPQSTSSLKSSDQRPVSTLDYYHLAHAGSLEYTHQHPTGLKPGDFFNRHHYYTSRIASIIVEELEKDNKCQEKTSLRETIPSVHKFSPEITLHVGQNDLASRSLKSISPLPYKSQVGPPQMIKSYNLASPVCDNTLKSTPQILPAHTARPSHSSVGAFLAFHLGHRSDGKDLMATAASFASAQTGFAMDDNIQPEDLSIKSNNSLRAQAKPSNTKSCPNDTAIEEHSQGYFSSPTSPVLTSLLGCHAEPSQVLQKPPPSPRHNHKKDVDYNSDGETAVNAFKTVGNWEKKGQVHGLDIPLKGDSKAVEKRRAESLKSWSGPGDGDVRKTRELQTTTVVPGLQR